MCTMSHSHETVRSEPPVLSPDQVRDRRPRVPRRRTCALGAVVLLFPCAACDSARAPSAPSPATNEAVVSTPTAVPTPAFRFVPSPQAAPSSPTDPIVGRYTLDLAIGSNCPSIPEGERDRTYTADIASVDETTYVVTLFDAAFLEGPCSEGRFPKDGTRVCNRFLASRTDESSVLGFSWGWYDDWNRSVVEQLSNGRWLTMAAGHATGPVQGATIAATGSISVSYWMDGDSCDEQSLRMSFTRR